MVAAQAQSTIQPRDYPQISAEVRMQIAADRRRLIANPDAAVPPAELGRTEKYLFRSKPGSRKTILVTIPLAPHEAQYETDKKYEFAKRTWDRVVAQPAYPDMERKAAAEKFAARMEDLRDRLGDTMIRFVRVPRHIECVFGTDDIEVAKYIRELIASGKEPFNDVYEESGAARVVVGDKAFPNSNAGWNAARAYAAENNIEDIKLVKE